VSSSVFSVFNGKINLGECFAKNRKGRDHMQKSNLKTKRCVTCGQKLPTWNAYTPKPMLLDSRLKRATSSLATTLRLLADQRGKPAARAALKQLQNALKF
jgi:hypothetical protein